jgi:hypothetical protein
MMPERKSSIADSAIFQRSTQSALRIIDGRNIEKKTQVTLNAMNLLIIFRKDLTVFCRMRLIRSGTNIRRDKDVQKKAWQ